MKTKARQLGITKFPYREYDGNNNQTYWEGHNGTWWKWRCDTKGDEIYHEDSDGLKTYIITYIIT